MNKEYLLKLAKFNIWANEIVFGWFNQITEQQWNTKLVGSMGSIAETAVHIAGAEKAWCERFNNKSEPFLASYFNGSKAELIDIWKLASNDLLHYIEKSENDEFDNSFNYNSKDGIPFSSGKSEALMHVFNHSTYHRGQIVNFLRQVGFTNVSSTDMITFFRENNQ
jgi:uncharacterized damage-inducible protein DinB